MTPERKERILKMVSMRLDGMTYAQIGKALGNKSREYVWGEISSALAPESVSYDGKVTDLYNTGITQGEIAKSIGISQATVSNIVRRLGIGKKGRRPVVHPEVITLYNQGVKFKDIAKEVGLAVGTVQMVVDRARRKDPTIKPRRLYYTEKRDGAR